MPRARDDGLAPPRPQTSRTVPRRRGRFTAPLEALESRQLLATVSATALNFSATEGQANPAIQVAKIADSDATVVPSNLSATIDWGDGSPTTAGTITQDGPGAFTVSGAHTFIEESGSVVPPSAFNVNVTVHDTKNSTQAQATGQASVNDAALLPGDPITPGAPQLFSGVGTSSATSAEQAFQAAVGGVVNTTPQPQVGGSRKITWDGVKVDGTDFGGGANTTVISQGSTVAIPLNRFEPQGVYFGANYAVSNNGFATVNPSVAGLFPAFSAPNTFAMFNDNGIDFKFVAPAGAGTTIVSAASRGFGAIFENVRIANTTSIEFFHGSTLLDTVFAPVGSAGQPEFVGGLFSSPIVTNVVLNLGTDAIFSFNGTTFSASGATDNPGAGHNLVVTDDWVYAEPVPIANGFPIVSGPQGTANAVSSVAATAGVPFTGVVGTFSDTDPNGNAKDYTATINWGDGHSTNGAITADGAGGFSVSGTNTYALAGSFPINVDIQDFGGGPGASGSQPTLSVNNTATVARAATSVLLATSAANPTAGQAVTLTATVSPGQAQGVPSGLVTFLDGSTPLATVPLTNGQASFTTSGLVSGGHTLTAMYVGDTNFAASTSPGVTVTVGRAASMTALALSSPITIVGQPVTLTANIGAGAGSGTPTGVVVFLDGSTPLRTVPVVNGQAKFTTNTLSPGGHALIAFYTGDASFAPSFTFAGESITPDVTGLIAITAGKIQRVGHNHFQQQLSLKNTGANPIPGPIALVLDSLAKGVTLHNADGTTRVWPPLGSPFVFAALGAGRSQLAPGATALVFLDFFSPIKAIPAIPRVLAGTNLI